MKRRNFLGSAIVGAAATGLAAPAIAQGTTTLRLASVWALGDSVKGSAATRFANRLNVVAAGRIKVELVPDGQYSDPATLLAAVSAGEIEMYFGSQEHWRDQSPALAMFTSVPGGMNADELEAFVHYGDGQFLWDTISAELGIKPYLGGDLGPAALWSRDPIADMSALASLRTASMGLGLDALAASGANDLTEIGLDAKLPAGVRIDAFEGLSAAEVSAAGLQTTHRHMTHPGHNRPSTAMSFGLNLSTFSALSDDDQNLIHMCAAAEHADSRALSLIANTNAINEMAGLGAITQTAVPDGLWDAQRDSTEAALAAIESHDFASADAAGAYRYFLEDVSIWSAIGKTAFVSSRNRALKGA